MAAICRPSCWSAELQMPYVWLLMAFSLVALVAGCMVF